LSKGDQGGWSNQPYGFLCFPKTLLPKKGERARG
jgi:hypothetical protein